MSKLVRDLTGKPPVVIMELSGNGGLHRPRGIVVKILIGNGSLARDVDSSAPRPPVRSRRALNRRRQRGLLVSRGLRRRVDTVNRRGNWIRALGKCNMPIQDQLFSSPQRIEWCILCCSI